MVMQTTKVTRPKKVLSKKCANYPDVPGYSRHPELRSYWTGRLEMLAVKIDVSAAVRFNVRRMVRPKK